MSVANKPGGFFAPAEALASPIPSSLVYEPLDKTCDSFRLLEILPGRYEERVQCLLWNARIQESVDAGGYSCLSYQWEKPWNKSVKQEAAYQISVNGSLVSIGENLWDFLFSARSNKLSHQPLWIDALCINQGDSSERSHQVKQMALIYGRAKSVLVWLGDWAWTRKFVKSWEEMHEYFHLKEADPEAAEMNSECKIRWEESLSTIWSSPYWSRVWIIQEIMLSKTPILYLPTGQVSADDLIGIRLSLGIGDSKSPGANIMWSHFIEPTEDYENLFQENRRLSALLLKYTYRGCQNTLDHVYGLLSLASDASNFPIDYNISQEVLFARVMEHCMDGLALDEVLLLGGFLIEALDIRSATTQLVHATSGPISNIFSGYLDLDLQDSNDPHQHTKERMQSVYFGIKDADDIHIFEYAVVTTESTVSVQYSRAHEYLKGTPQMSQDPPVAEGNQYYRWIPLPSEDVYYFVHPKTEPRGRINAWTTLGPRFVDLVPSLFDQHGASTVACHTRMKPSRRSFQDRAFSGGILEREPGVFDAAVSELWKFGPSAFSSMPQTMRSTTTLWPVGIP